MTIRWCGWSHNTSPASVLLTGKGIAVQVNYRGEMSEGDGLWFFYYCKWERSWKRVSAKIKGWWVWMQALIWRRWPGTDWISGQLWSPHISRALSDGMNSSSKPSYWQPQQGCVWWHAWAGALGSSTVSHNNPMPSVVLLPLVEQRIWEQWLTKSSSGSSPDLGVLLRRGGAH